MFDVQEYIGSDAYPLRYGRLINKEQPETGRALWFLPGLGGSVKGALSFLEQLLPGFSPIYGSDLRGFGLNPLETPLHTAKGLMADIDAFYEQVIAPANHQKLVLCGISLGGVLATLLAVRHPQRFKRLILLAPAYKPHTKTFTLNYTIQSALNLIWNGKQARTTLPYGLSALTRNEAILNDPQYRDQPPLVLNPGFLLSTRTLCLQAFADIAKIQIPTMMVIPGQDIICDPKAMRQAFGRIPVQEPNAKLCKEYPDFYHDVLFETGHSEIAQEVLKWSLVSSDSLMTSSSFM